MNEDMRKTSRINTAKRALDHNLTGLANLLKDDQLLERWRQECSGYRRAKQVELVKGVISLGHSSVRHIHAIAGQPKFFNILIKNESEIT